MVHFQFCKDISQINLRRLDKDSGVKDKLTDLPNDGKFGVPVSKCLEVTKADTL